MRTLPASPDCAGTTRSNSNKRRVRAMLSSKSMPPRHPVRVRRVDECTTLHQNFPPCPPGLRGRLLLRPLHHPPPRLPVRVRRVDECTTLDQIFRHCLPAFGGAYLRRIYTILDRAIGEGCPLTLSISGPVTVSGQHLAWLIPLLETGWVAYISTTDAVCYHDG